MKRREFIDLSAASIGGLLLYGLTGEPMVVHAQAGAARVPLRFFTEAEARTVVAACERIFPADESGPGATQANVVIYIDRQLAGPYGSDQNRYTQAPFVESVPEHGYQGKANPREIYRAGLATLGADFAQAGGALQDERLAAQEKTVFFQLLRQHTLEGMFCDPMHGGNAGLIGWQLIGYPGPQMSFYAQIDQFQGTPYRVEPQSLSTILGHPVKPWEDEGRG